MSQFVPNPPIPLKIRIKKTKVEHPVFQNFMNGGVLIGDEKNYTYLEPKEFDVTEWHIRGASKKA